MPRHEKKLLGLGFSLVSVIQKMAREECEFGYEISFIVNLGCLTSLKLESSPTFRRISVVPPAKKKDDDHNHPFCLILNQS